jgi:hypothetical protein
LLSYAAFVAIIATREHVYRGAVWVIVIINALWVLEAVVVALFAELQVPALRRAPQPAVNA